MTRRMTRRRFVGSAAMAGAGIGAYSAGVLQPGRVSAQDEEVKLSWAVNNFSPTEVDLVQRVVDQFVAERPNYEVSVIGYDPATYDQKLLADIAAGTLPDIFVNADVFTKPFFDAGLTADLRPCAEETGLNLDDFDEKFLQLAEYDGKVGFLPRAADVVVLYYNKRMFDEAGVAYPDENWTYDDMMAAAEQLTVKDADGTVTQYGYSADYTWWAYWVPMVVAEGGSILSDDNSEAAFNSPEGMRAWEIIATGLKNEWFVPQSVQDTMGGPYAPFAGGKAAMTPTIRGLTPTFRDQLTDDWDVTLVPQGSADRKSGMGTMGYAMSASSEQPEAACELLNYVYTEGMQVFMETYLLVPPIKSFYDDPAWRDLPGPPYTNEVFVTATESAMLPPPLPFYSTGPFRQAMEDGLDGIILDNMTVEQAVNRMAEEATRALQSG